MLVHLGGECTRFVNKNTHTHTHISLFFFCVRSRFGSCSSSVEKKSVENDVIIKTITFCVCVCDVETPRIKALTAMYY